MDMTHETDKIVEIERQKIEVENERFAIEDECCSIKKRIDVLDGVAAQVGFLGKFCKRVGGISIRNCGN